MTPKQLAIATGARIDRAQEYLQVAFQAMKGLFFRYPSPYPPVHASRMNTKGATSSANAGVINAANGYGYQVSFVFSPLLLLCRPTNISGLIVPILIQPVNRISSPGYWPNIRKEGRKILNPWAKHSNTTASISRPTSNFWIKASLLHSNPAIVFWAAGISSSVTVLSNLLHGFLNKCPAKIINPFFCQAPARLRLSISELPSPCNFVIAATAPAKPSCALASRWKYLANYCKSAIDMTGQINFFHGEIIAKTNYGVRS